MGEEVSVTQQLVTVEVVESTVTIQVVEDGVTNTADSQSVVVVEVESGGAQGPPGADGASGASTFSDIAGDPYDNVALAEALDAAGVTDHGALTGLGDNDHPQYVLGSTVGQADGVAGLDGSGKVPLAQLPTLSIASTDDVPEGTSNLYFTTPRVLATALTGLSLLSSADVLATDTVLVAMGKLQKQATDIRANYLPLSLAGNTTVAQNGHSLTFDGTVSVASTRNAGNYEAYAATPTIAAAGAVDQTTGYSVYTATLGAGATLGYEIGFGAYLSGVSASGTTHGFFGEVAPGDNNYNLYMESAAKNYLAGPLEIGETAQAPATLWMGGAATGTVDAYAAGIYIKQTLGATHSYYEGVVVDPIIGAGHAINQIGNFEAWPATLEAGASLNYQYGFAVYFSGASATHNYGLYSQVPVGTDNYNLYMDSAAKNYLGGPLHVGKSPRATHLWNTYAKTFIGNDTAGTGQFLTLQQAGNDAYFSELSLSKSRGTIAAPAAVQSGDGIGSVGFYACDGVDLDNDQWLGGIFVSVTGAVSAGSVPSEMQFWTGDGTTTAVRLTIDNAGAAAFTGNVNAANLSGTNTGDQTSIVGITGTKAQFDTACTDGNFAYQSDLASYLTTAAAAAAYQPLDTQLTALAGLSYTGNSLKVVRVNVGETGFELATITAASGDVVGPASSVDSHVALFDGTTGKLIKDSGLTLSGSNTGDQTITLTGDVTGSGTGSFAATLATAQPAVHTWALAQTFTVAPVFTDQSGSRTALGLGTAAVKNTGTSGNTVPLLDGANTWSAQNTFAAGTITTSQPLTITQTWNAAGVTFTGIFANFTSTGSAAASLLLDLQVGGVSQFNITKTGRAVFATNSSSTSPSIDFGSANGITYFSNGMVFRSNGLSAQIKNNTLSLASNGIFGFTSGSGDPTGSPDTTMLRAAANSIQYAGNESTAGATTSRTELNKKVSSIANNTATDVLTVTIPNAAHSAQLYIELCGSLGAGGAIGANEASATNCYTVTFTRTAGVNAVATISAASGAAACAVAGAATVTCVGTLSAVSGAVGASNSFTIKATIARSGGSSTNHTCLVYAKLMNANASGITIA